MGFVAIFTMGAALCYSLGGLFGGRLVNRFGRKPLTVLPVLIAGISTIFFFNMPNLLLSLALGLICSLVNGVRFAASNSLTLEQVPRFRGTMMSLFSAANSLGSALGAGVGGLVLLLYDYEFVGISLGAMGIASAIVFYLLTIDPTRT